MKSARLFAPLAAALTLAVFASALTAAPSEVAALLARPIIAPTLPLAEVRAYAASRVPAMPPVTTLADWKIFAEYTRRDVLDKIVFRGDTARSWRDAKTTVVWLDTLPGGPGYSIKKLR